MSFNLAVILIAAIWVVLIAALVVWYVVARRRRAQGAAGAEAVEPGAPALDVTQPVQPLPQVPPQAFAPQPGSEPFGLTTQREYERLAAEPFQAPPAAALGEQSAPEPFSWTAASQSGPPVALPPTPERTDPPSITASPGTLVPPARSQRPAPPAGAVIDDEPLAPASAVSARKPTGITRQPVAPPAPPAPPARPGRSSGPGTAADEFDRTVVVPRAPAHDWVIALPDGEELPLPSDAVVGRRPTPIDGETVLIADPTRTVSKSHARLRLDGERWLATDLGSTNGLWLLHPDGREEQVAAYREVEATPRLRLGTLDVELRRRGNAG